MIFDGLTNVTEQLTKLQSIDEVYYRPDHYFTDIYADEYLLLSIYEKKELEGIYKQAYNTYTRNACESCREHKLIQLNAKLGLLFESVHERYVEGI